LPKFATRALVLLIEYTAVGLADQAFGLQNRRGGTSPLAEASNTKIEFPPSLGYEQSFRWGREKEPSPVHLGVGALNHAHGGVALMLLA